MASEFDLIRDYFTRPARRTVLGVGDDAALVRVTPGHELAISTDMLLAERHFFSTDPPESLGHKALAVNLSDLAAMGAIPRWALLSIALPEADAGWLEHFAAGWFGLAEQYGVALIGGDTTRGPLGFSVTIMGEVARGQALLRSGAKQRDEIWVSGELGDAGLALAHVQGRVQLTEQDLARILPRLRIPAPRIKLGQKLLGRAHSAIDISDGLLADLGHILEGSGVGAEIHWARLPLSKILSEQRDQALVRQLVLAAGDDYELCFTAPEAKHDDIVRIGRSLRLRLSCIGRITREPGLIVRDAQNQIIDIKEHGFDHFA